MLGNSSISLCFFPPISLLNKRWEAVMKSRCPQGLRCHLPIFLLVIFIFFILQTNSSDGLMVRSKRPYSNVIITCRASLYFIHSFLSLDSGLQFNIPIALQTIFQICLKCQRSCPDPPPWELRAVSLCDLLSEDKNGVELDFFDQVYLVSVSPMGRWFSV